MGDTTYLKPFIQLKSPIFAVIFAYFIMEKIPINNLIAIGIAKNCKS
jgi:hypothetical protein